MLDVLYLFALFCQQSSLSGPYAVPKVLLYLFRAIPCLFLIYAFKGPEPSSYFSDLRAESCSFPSPFTPPPHPPARGKGIIPLWEHVAACSTINLSLLIRTCLPSSLEPYRNRLKQSSFPSWTWQNCDTWKKKLVMCMAYFQEREQDLQWFVPLGRLAPHFI